MRPRRRWPILALAAACGHPGLGDREVEARYLRESAAACGGPCPERWSAAAPPPPHAGAILNVGFRARLPPTWRVLWLSAEAGGRPLPAPLPTGEHRVAIEVHARRSEPDAGPSTLLRQELTVPHDPATSALVEVHEGPGRALALTLRLERAPAPRPVPGRAVNPARAPRLEPARPIAVPPLRLPPELPATRGPAPVRVCLDRAGDHDQVRFLAPVHPRLAGAILDQLRAARHEPYRVDDRPVPSCHTATVRS